MKRSFRQMLAAAAVLAVSAAGTARAAGPTTVQLTPQNNSGESGTATLTGQGTKTKVRSMATSLPRT
jgi:hypothetical protein